MELTTKDDVRRNGSQRKGEDGARDQDNITIYP